MKTTLQPEPWQAVRTLLFLITCHLSLVTALQSQTLVNLNDTLYNADGTKASGRIVVSWDPFTAASGQTMDGGTLVYTIPATGASAGVVNLSLAPNIGAAPAGTSYRAQYFLANGASYFETWVVPSSGPVTIANVRASTPPTPITTINPSQVVGGTANRCARFDASGVLSSHTSDCGGGGGSITTREVDGAPSIVGTTILEMDQADGFVLTNPSGTTARLDLTNAPDSAVSDGITLTNLTQITNRAISDTTGDLAASRVDDGGAAATQALFSGAGAAAGFRAIADGDIPAALTRDSEVNVQGTANQIVSSGSGPAPTLSIANPFTFPGKATLAASVAGAASGNVPSGTAPSTPTAGDIWNESGLLKFRDATSTQTLLFQSRQISTSGAALSGGGDLSANRTIALSASPDSASVVGTGRTLTGGAGIAALGDLSADRTIATASGETDFLASGALTCGASTRGRMQVHTTPLQYCDNAATPALQYAAYANSSGEGTAAAANSVALGGDTTGSYVEQVADGTGIDGTANAEQATYTPTLDLTEINDTTWGDNSDATITHTFNPTGTTNPVWSYSDGVANLSTGTLQAGGVAVTTASNTQTLTNKTLTTPVIGAFTVSGLPAAGTANRVAIVTDSTSAGDCTTGGGSERTFCRDTGAAWQSLGDGGGGGGGDNISVNGTAATDADFDNATPTAPSDGINVRWQKDTGTPNNLSANVPTTSGGSAGTAAFNVGTAATIARSDHEHRTFAQVSWFFPGAPSTGVQTATATLPDGIGSPDLTDMRVTVNTTSASSSTFNIQRCTASCTGTSPTFADIYSTNLTLSANTRTAAKAAAPNQNVSGLAAGDQFKINIATLGSGAQDVTLTMTYRMRNTN
jgi:hypothetical protein